MSLFLDAVELSVGDGSATFNAVDGVTLTIERGELVALVGPSGSGKSSLLSVAAGLIAPTAGRVVIDGDDVTAMSDRQRTAFRRDNIGVVFQTSNLLASLTAREQLQLITHIAGDSAASGADRADELLRALGVGGRADSRPHELSGGERQRVGLARALMGEPPVVLADEPTASLDLERTREIGQLLADVAHERDVALFVATHDPEVVPFADRVVTIRDGSLVES